MGRQAKEIAAKPVPVGIAVLETGYLNKPRRLARQGSAGWQPLRYRFLSSNILASRVFFCTAIAENMLRQNAMA